MNKIVLAVLGFCGILFFACADNSLPEFPKFVGESSSVTESSSSSEASSSSTIPSSSSAELYSSSEASSSSTIPSSSSALKECVDIFNPANKFCYDGILYNKCDGIEYNPTVYICTGDVAILAKCGDQRYNPLTQKCTGGIVETMCGNGWYNATKEFCSGTSIYDKCGGTVPYEPTIEQCCGNSKYTTATHFCTRSESNPQIVELCGGEGYDTRTKFCYNSSKVGNLCGNRTEHYDPDLYECKTGKNGIYLKKNKPKDLAGKEYEAVLIGTQTWMAENLNYNAPSSKCYAEGVSGVSEDSIAKNCAQYGRLYDWATAMALPSSCNSTFCASSINTKHQGICPSGWHIPNDDEWDTLMNSVGGSSGTKLKATEGWYDCGKGGSYSYQCEDAYGFSALPGGDYDHRGYFSYYGLGHWWSASAFHSEGANCRGVWYYDEALFGCGVYKDNLLSVRCVQD